MKENSSPAPDAWRWRKSSYSEPNGGECIELGWRKSSYSQPNGECVELGWHKSSCSQPTGNCVELAPTLDGVRDSKNPAGPMLTARALPALLDQLKAGRFDR